MQRCVKSCVYLFERLMPDPFVIVILLTVITSLCAFFLAPKGAPSQILSGWYKGIIGIFTFAFQMVMILVTGHALANARIVKAGMQTMARLATGPCSAVAIVFAIGSAATFLNWGFGLVVGAMLSKEVAKQVRIDFAWLVAASYTSWVLWAFTGMSSSIALSIASPGNPLNLVEQQIHAVVPLADTVFASWVLLPGVLATVLLAVLFMVIRPASSPVIAADPTKLAAEDNIGANEHVDRDSSFAGRLERSRICVMSFVAAGAAYLALQWSTHGVSLDINTVIFIFLLAGLGLHGSARAYVGAISKAAAVVGPMLLQYPFYGGIMGIMSATGLDQVASSACIHLASSTTLPFWSYIGSLFITLFIPSGGGHWAVQGPFTIPAAVQLGATLPGTSMAIATGELAASLLQPFWAIPVVAIAGVGVQRVLGFTFIAFLVAGTFFSLVYLFLVPAVLGH
jgi:short-chain fatty acids transporter